MSWLNFLLQANIYLLVFYAFYKLLLAKETYFQLNRLYLIGSGLFAMAIPFIRLDWLMQQPLSQQLSVTFGELDMMVLPDEQQASSSLAAGDIVALLYCAGVLLFLFRFAVQVFLLAKRLYASGISSNADGTAYSFLTRKSVDPGLPGQEIINHHEDIHLKQFHSLDILLFELIAIINWFNPVVYLYKRALRDNHEFLADEAAADYQGDKEGYSLLLLSAAFKVSPQALTNSFFSKQSLIKKRIYMLHKEKSKRTAILKYGLYLPLFSGMLLLSSANFREDPAVLKAVETIPFNDPLTTVKNALPIMDTPEALNDATSETTEENASIISQDWEPFYSFIGKNIKYPEQARKQQVQGNAQTKFTLENGTVKTLEVLTKLGAGIDAEVMRTILNYKDFKAQPDGNYVLNVTFKLNGSTTAMQNEPIKPVEGFTNLKQITIVGYSTSNAQAKNSSSEVMDFVSVDTPPSFPGGIDKFYSFIGRSIKYPAEAVKNNVQGKVFLSYVVEKDGSLRDIELAGRPLGSGTDEEAIRVLQTSPKWNPGLIDGKPVAVKYHIPISFTLSKEPANGGKSTMPSDSSMKAGFKNAQAIRESTDRVYMIDGVVSTKEAAGKLNADDIERVDVDKSTELKPIIRITTKKK